MKKKYLLFARDPGGVNVVAPLVSELTLMGQEVSLYGKDFALSRFKNYQLDPINIIDEINKISVEGLTSFLKKKSPDVVITGTGADDMTEKLIWKSCKDLRINSYAVLDQWVNYGIRFSRWGVDEI